MKQTELHDFFGGYLSLVPKVAEKHSGTYCPNSGSTYYNSGLPTLDRNPWGVFNPDLLPYTEKYIPLVIPTKHDSGKADWSLMPFEAVEEINKVLEFGANKYAAHNWQIGSGFKYTRVISSLLRHVFAFMRGEDNDPESGLSHIAHAGCNIIFLLYYIKNKKRYSNDDRYVSK